MRDAVSIKRVAILHPAVRAEVIKLIEQVEAKMPPGESIRIVQGLRTIEEQNALYAIGRTIPGKKVTNAKGGSSFHNYGLAIDYARMIGKTVSWDPYQPMITAFKKAGWMWGGDFKSIKDQPHFEKAFGFTIADLRKRYKPGQYVDLKR